MAPIKTLLLLMLMALLSGTGRTDENSLSESVDETSDQLMHYITTTKIESAALAIVKKGLELTRNLLIHNLFNSNRARFLIYGVGLSTFIRLLSNLALQTLTRKVTVVLALPMLASMVLAVALAAGISSLPIGTSMSRFDYNSNDPRHDNILFDSLNNYESPLILMPSFPNPNPNYPVKSSPLQFLSTHKQSIVQLVKSIVNKLNDIRRRRQ